MLSKNDIVRTEIIDISNEGSGVCRIDGFTVFVPETAVGDILDIKIVKVLKNYGFGIIQKIIEPSKTRIENGCPVYRKCGGCCYRHISYREECRIKLKQVNDAFARIGGFDISAEGILGSEKIDGYRNKAQLPVGLDESGRAAAGFFAKRSHRIVECSHCSLTPKIFGEIIEQVIAFVNEYNISVYDESKNKGLLRHIYLRQNHDGSQIMLCLVCTRAELPHKNKLLGIIAEKFPMIKTVVININSRRTNVILGEKCVALAGDGTITDIMCGNRVSISPLSFYQVNREQAQRLYQKGMEYAELRGDETMLDLYCGIGTIGLSAAGKIKKLIGAEIIPQAVENARLNAQMNGYDNAEFLCGDCSDMARRFEEEGIKPDVIVLDPPRKGCDTAVIDSVCGMSPDRIVMISCNPATAARDCRLLCDKGYELKKLCAVDMFPRTGHVECVVLMTKAQG